MDENNNRAGENEEITIDLYEILYLFRQKIVFIIVALVVGAVVAGIGTKLLITPKYSSTAKLYIVSSSSSSVVNLSDLQLGTNLAPDYRELMTARPLLLSVKSNLNLPYKIDELRKMITVANTSGTRILTVTITSPDPEEAAHIRIIGNRHEIPVTPHAVVRAIFQFLFRQCFTDLIIIIKNVKNALLST